jgi:hypothetical protein
MPSNRWQIGALYYDGYVNGQPFFVQPGGIGTAVFPTQKNAAPWPEYPIPGLVINEYVPIWAPPCGHAISFFKIIRDFDIYTNQSVALVCCSICAFVIRAITPYEEYLNPIQQAIIVA